MADGCVKKLCVANVIERKGCRLVQLNAQGHNTIVFVNDTQLSCINVQTFAK